MKASKNLILREIAGEYILVPVGKIALKLHGMISLSESGHFLWKMLQDECTEEELVDSILKEYDVDRKTAAEDVRDFINKMEQLGIIE